MRVLIAGSHGNVGQRLTRVLRDRGHEVVAMIRDPSQEEEMRGLGGTPLVADLTGDVSAAPEGCDAIVFTAGAGAGSGPGPKETVDKGGAVKLVDAALDHGLRRYVMVSSMRTDDPESGPERLRPYLKAKRAADEYLAKTDLDWTIVRPGRLTDEPGDGKVQASLKLTRGGEISRDDVAAVIAAVLDRDDLGKVTFDLLDGDTPVDDALDHLAAGDTAS